MRCTHRRRVQEFNVWRGGIIGCQDPVPAFTVLFGFDAEVELGLLQRGLVNPLALRILPVSGSAACASSSSDVAADAPSQSTNGCVVNLPLMSTCRLPMVNLKPCESADRLDLMLSMWRKFGSSSL